MMRPSADTLTLLLLQDVQMGKFQLQTALQECLQREEALKQKVAELTSLLESAQPEQETTDGGPD